MPSYRFIINHFYYIIVNNNIILAIILLFSIVNPIVTYLYGKKHRFISINKFTMIIGVGYLAISVLCGVWSGLFSLVMMGIDYKNYKHVELAPYGIYPFIFTCLIYFYIIARTFLRVTIKLFRSKIIPAYKSYKAKSIINKKTKQIKKQNAQIDKQIKKYKELQRQTSCNEISIKRCQKAVRLIQLLNNSASKNLTNLLSEYEKIAKEKSDIEKSVKNTAQLYIDIGNEKAANDLLRRIQ